MNINGECRTVIANNPENFAKIFNITYYKTTNNKNIYCANNILKFRLMAGDCVKEFSFVNNKKKYNLVDLTPSVNWKALVINNTLHGTLSSPVRHPCSSTAVIMQVTYCEGLGFIDFVDLDNFYTRKESLSNIEFDINTIYDLSCIYQNAWKDLKN